MLFTPQIKMNIRAVIITMITWSIVGIFVVCYNNSLLSTPYLSLGPSKIYQFKIQLGIWSFISSLGGLISGTFLVEINRKLFRKKSFRYALITTVYSYMLLFIVLMSIYLSIRAYLALGQEATINLLLRLAIEMTSNAYPLVHFILWGFVTLSTLFMLQINDKFGPGILKKFLLGNYSQPKKEARIFMFLDMKSSTTIAEEIGNEKYFYLLRNLFSHLTDAILNHEGEIYQYVGDEIVISWPIKNGIRNANCIHCFLKIKSKLIELQPFYKEKYGITPTFKAGIHFGQVMAGEVGVIKKDIIFSGDILNTAARIQAKCNEYNVDFLISKNTLKLISQKDLNSFEAKEIGAVVLRGKKEEILLSSIHSNS
jgi:adenylate cyclase